MSENKKILVTEFVEKYNELKSADLKAKRISSVVRRTYCPLLEKKLILELMLEKSIKEEDIKYVDLFVNRINFIAAIITLYTTLLPEKDENGVTKTYEMYDLLVENDILDLILHEIGEREISELTSVNKMILDNWYAQNSSTEVYIKNLVEMASQKVGVVASVGMEKLAEVLDDENKMNRVIGALDKVMKKIKK